MPATLRVIRQGVASSEECLPLYVSYVKVLQAAMSALHSTCHTSRCCKQRGVPSTLRVIRQGVASSDERPPLYVSYVKVLQAAMSALHSTCHTSRCCKQRGVPSTLRVIRQAVASSVECCSRVQPRVVDSYKCFHSTRINYVCVVVLPCFCALYPSKWYS